MILRFMFMSLLVAMAMYWGTAHSAGMKSLPFSFSTEQADTLSFYNTHTRKTLTVTFDRTKPVKRDFLQKISHFLRDHRTDDVHHIAPDLIALLADIQRAAQTKVPNKDIVFHVISGYRSPKTNNMLRNAGGGQAKKSRHMHGDAIDIRVPGFDTKMLRNIAWCQQKGGVGYYAGSNFIHIDTYRVRFWNWSPKGLDCDRVLTP